MNKFTDSIKDWAGYNLKNCIGVDACMKVCPVVSPDIPISDLNTATVDGNPIPQEVEQFATDCVQCGNCDPVCPTAAGRSLLMVALRARLKREGKENPHYTKYLKLKGFDKNSLVRGAFNLYAKGGIGELAPFVDKDKLKSCNTLLFFGCYIFTHEKGALYTKQIADYLNLDYDILGGLKSCCGWPQFLAGDLGGADRYHEYLYKAIKEASPEYVVTGCAECYMSLRKLKTLFNADFTPLTTSEWILMHKDSLPLKKENQTVTFHDSCHISRKLRMPEPGRRLLSEMAEIKEMKRSGSVDTYCCGYWNFHSNQPLTDKMHKSRYDEVKETGVDKMVVECITCKESFKDADKSDISVIDIVEMVHNQIYPEKHGES